MSNVIKLKVKKKQRPTIEMVGVEYNDMLRLAFGVEATLIRIIEMDKKDAVPVYSARIKLSKSEGYLASQEVVKAAIYVWDECYKGRFFDSFASVITQFIDCVSEAAMVEKESREGV